MFGFSKMKSHIDETANEQFSRWAEATWKNKQTNKELKYLSTTVSDMIYQMDIIYGHVQALTSHLGLEAEKVEKDTIILKTKEETKNG